MDGNNRKRIFIEIFLFLICTPWIFWGVLKNYAPKTFENLTGNLEENRKLTEFSIEDASAYIDDHVPFRDTIIEIYQNRNTKAETSFRRLSQGIMRHFSEAEEAQVADTAGMFDNKQEEVEIKDVRVEVEETEAHSHSYVITESLDPTCEADGYAVFTCECGDTYTEQYPAKGHSGSTVYSQEASYETYGYEKCICHACGKYYYVDTAPKLIDTSELAPVKAAGDILFGRFDWLFYTGNDSIGYYTGSNAYDEETLASYAAKVNALQSLCDERGVELCILFAPNKEQVYSEYMPTYEIADEYKRIPRLVDYLRENTSVHVVYPLEEMKAYSKYYPTYYKYDTHWNNFGAFVGIQAAYKEMGREYTDPLQLDGYFANAERASNFALGGIDATNYPFDTEYIIKYKEDVVISPPDYQSQYFCMESDRYGSGNAIVIGDSFREAMEQIMTKDFKKVTYLHRDYIGNCANDLNESNVIFLVAVERYSSKVFKDIDNLITMMGGTVQ